MITPLPETSAAGETLERIAKRIARKHVCGCHECKTDRAALETDILSALHSERERCARVLESRADELQCEWDAPPSAANGFITMTADTPAGYATYYTMNQLRKLATAIREGK